MEIWKDLKNYESNYKISNFGNIYSKYSNKNLNFFKCNGYEYVSLYKKQKHTKKKLVHRLVVENFIRKLKKYEFIDHINRNRSDNNLYNLIIVTRKQNNLNRLHNQPSRSIYQYNFDNNLIKIFNSVKEIPYPPSGIYNCLSKKQKTSNGYIWKYKKLDLESDEIFKNIGLINNNNYSRYEISNYGNVRNKIILKNSIISGYKTISLTDKNKNQKTFLIHRLVAKIFILGESDINNIVNHKDGNKFNNYYKNLEWTSPRKNTIHSIGKKIQQIDKHSDEIIETFLCIKDAYTKLGLKYNSNIGQICKGKGKTAYGYKWKFY